MVLKTVKYCLNIEHLLSRCYYSRLFHKPGSYSRNVVIVTVIQIINYYFFIIIIITQRDDKIWPFLTLYQTIAVYINHLHFNKLCLVSIVHNSSVCIILKKKNSYQICYQIVITFSASEMTYFLCNQGNAEGDKIILTNKISSYMIHKFKSVIALCPTRQSVKCWECYFMIENLRKLACITSWSNSPSPVN